MDGLVYINKPRGWTSFDVVAKCKRIFKTKSVGHTGTLDPEATGVLIVMVGKACKANPYLVSDEKEYIATLQLGKKYDTGDVWGKVLEEKNVDVSKNQIIDAILSMHGKQMQIPPMYSAIKVNGKKLYEYARENISIQVEPRPIEIFEIEVLEVENEIKFRVVCSSGTYIRTLCEDIAVKLNTVGAMSSLVRTKVANVTLEDCLNLEDISEDYKCIDTLQVLKSRYVTIEADEKMKLLIEQGKKIVLNTEEDLVCISYKDMALAMLEKMENGLYKSKRGLW